MLELYQSVLYLLLSLCAIGETALCTHGSYLNLCGYCVGGTTNKSDLEGLDRCGICNGQSDCVGCDGIINSPRRRDTCGLCLPTDAEQWNDCRKIRRVYPSILDLSVDSELLPLTIIGAGLALSDMNNTQCHFFPLESQSESPIVREISLEETEIQVKVFLGKSMGMYRIGCSEIEDFAELRIVDSRRINVINVKPLEVTVDQEVELEVEIGEDSSGNTNGTYWCFLKKKRGEPEILRVVGVSGKTVKCSKYIITTPGIFYVGVVAREDAALGENTTGRTAELLSRAKPPIPETAVYSPDLQNIAITFDQNIKILDCNRTFSPETEKSLGKDFICYVVADTLYVILGDGQKLAESLTIIEGNSIERAGSLEPGLSPNAREVTIPVSKQNVLTPRFTLSSPNVICADKSKQPIINVKVSKLGKQNLNYTWVTPPTNKLKGRSQRENILMWKRARAAEAELNNKSNFGVFYFNRTSLHPDFNYILNLRLNNAPGKNRELVRSLTMPKEGNLSITVMTFPSTSVIAAEVKTTFCEDKDQTALRYKWKVDDKEVSNDGRLLIIPQTSPGTYNISCSIYTQQNNQFMGTGWSLTEVVKFSQPVIIFPTDTVVGVMDDIILEAYSSETQFRWSCITANGDPCITIGPRANPIEDIVDIKSSKVQIPSRLLPVGRYIWSLNGMESATASVTIAEKIPPIIKIVTPQPKIDSAIPLSLNADVERLKPGCKIRWKTIHRKGYHYFDLQEDVGLGGVTEVQVDDTIMGEREVPLLIPPARGKWKGLTSGAMYLLRLQTICPEPTPESYTDVTVTVNAPPTGADFQITPEIGQTINTKFTIIIIEGSDSVEDYPFFYRISYKDGSDEVQMGVTVLTNFTLILPPGNITVIVKNCDVWNSCSKSSKFIMVRETSNSTSEMINYLSQEIRNDMLSGDTIQAYGKAITMFKSLSQNQDNKEKLDVILTITESAIRDRLRDLTERFHSNPNLKKQSFEFLEQSVMSLKFFPDTKELVTTLTEFKNLITRGTTSNRKKREIILATKEKEMRFIVKYSLSNRSLERIARDTTDIKLNENTIKAIFDLHAKILEQNDTTENREEFLKDVRKYMIENCRAIQDSVQGPVLIKSSIITLEVMKLTQNQMKKDLPIIGSPNSKIRFNFKTIPKKTCVAIAKYERNFMGNIKLPRVVDIFEIRLIKNETFKDFKDYIKSMVIALPLHNNDSHQALDCMTWNEDRGWKPTCTLKKNAGNVISCDCKEPGIVSAFMVNMANQSFNETSKSLINSETTKSLLSTTLASTTEMSILTITTITSTTSTIIVNTNATVVSNTTTNVNTNVPAATTTTSTTTTTTTTTTTDPTVVTNFNKFNNSSLVTTVQTTTLNISRIPATEITTDKVVSTSVKLNISDIVGNTITTNNTLYMSGTFVIEEDYWKTVGKNETIFKNSLKKQLAQQLSISEKVIANLIIAPGSILVTVLFIDTEETKAETAIKELYAKLHEGSLRLTSDNATILRVSQQDLKIKVGTTLTRNTGKVRLITYGVVTGTLIAIFLFAIGASYFKRKRTRLPLRLPRLSIDDHPTYRQFHNEFSLDGSSATLERYRRNHPFETETM